MLSPSQYDSFESSGPLKIPPAPFKKGELFMPTVVERKSEFGLPASRRSLVTGRLNPFSFLNF